MDNTQGRELAGLFGKELGRLAAEVEAYDAEESLWQAVGAQKNPPGTLALHVVGSLLHFVGAELGGTGYVRDRDAEFAGRDVPRGDLLRRIADCRATVTSVLESLSDERMSAVYPGNVPDEWSGSTTRVWLVHLLWHTGWHLGHIYYHRLALEA